MEKKNNFFEMAHYVAPGCKIKSIQPRKMLCQSVGFKTPGWTKGEEDWFVEED